MRRILSAASIRPLLAGLVLLFVASALGCANGEFRFGDPFDRQISLAEAQHRYTVLIRWSQFQKARSYVTEANVGAFLAQTKFLEDARFTEYESEPVELDQKKEQATIRVTYTVYTPAMPYEIKLTELQEWTRSGVTNDWRVVSTFENLNQLASN